jgi:pimeloyl-ACP methyl ester carboxylesterase
MQFPELGTEFDVRGMSVDMKDRSSLNDLVNMVLNYIDESIQSDEGENRHIYLVGESFGGILALEVATAIKERNLRNVSSGLSINLQGVTLINPATCYNQSKLARDAPPLTQIPSFLYPFALLRLIPLFTDNYALPQLLLILQSKALPSVIDTPQREAYMGRTALSLPFALKFMPQETLKWRLTEWLTKGCTSIQEKEGDVKRLLGDLPVLIVAGEEDQTLPSVMEANRISSALFKRSKVHIVPGAGHACTSGSRVDLTALMREWFPLEYEIDGRLQMKDIAVEGSDLYFGMERRYDRANIGLSPLLYWSEDYYKKI